MHTSSAAQRLAGRLGIDGVREASALKSGLGGTELWRLHRDVGDLVLRAFPAGTDPATAEREAVAHELARRHRICAPKVIVADTVDGRPILVMAWVHGELLAERLWSSESPGSWGRRCGALLARVHQIPGRPRVIGDRSWIGWAGEHAAELNPLLRPVGPEALLHLDFHPENLIVDGHAITIIDWANVRIGPPAADLARSLSILELITEAHPELTDAAREQARRFQTGLLSGYAAAGGDPTVPGPVRAWAYAVQLHDLAGSWVPDDYFARLRAQYTAALDDR